MADPPLLALSGIRFHLGDQTVLNGVDLSIAPGERLSLVGRNGAGKSTLLRILAGEPIADGGTRFAQPGATITTLPQEPDFSSHASVAHYVASALTDSLGTALGIGITGAAVAASVRATAEPAQGLLIGFVVAIAVAVLGLLVSVRLRVARSSEPSASVVPVAGS